VVCTIKTVKIIKQVVFITNNKALKQTINNNELEDGVALDCYNKTTHKDCIHTITTRVSASNETFIAIKNANSKGYLEDEDGDGIDISSRMETHRGTVQKGICQTLKTQTDVGVCVDDEKQ